jgi:CRP-like cAMP-binding protein
MLRHRPDVSAFAGVPMFEGFDADVLAPLAPYADRLAVTPGVTLAPEGRHTHEVLVIVSGEVIVTRDGVAVDRIGPGAVIGADEELAGTAHDATYVAGAGVAALVLRGSAFRWAAQSLAGFVPTPSTAAG